MPRASTYHEDRLNRDTPISQQPTQQPTQQADLTMPQTQDFTANQAMGKIQQDKDATLKKYIDEGNRSLWSRMPYELGNTLYNAPADPNKKWYEGGKVGSFDYPSEEEYSQMDRYEKQELGGKAGKALVKRMLAGFPKVLAQAGFKTALTIAQMAEERIRQKFGFQHTDDRIVPSKINIPVPLLGEISGFRGIYEDRIEEGFLPFFAAVSATGEVAGDATITASLTQTIGSVFKPSVKTVGPKVKGTDTRQFEEVKIDNGVPFKSSGLSKTNNATKGKVFDIKSGVETEYMKVPNSVAAKYKGNSNNTFLKITPTGQGMAEFSIVQTRASLSSRTRNAFAKKFGKDKVVQGKDGPEIVVDSAKIKYNPEIALKNGDSVPFVKTAKMEKVLRKDPVYETKRLGQLDNELAVKEAGKFKTADEFVGSYKKLYRGGKSDGPYTSTDKSIAKDYAKERGGKVDELFIRQDAKIADYEQFPNAEYAYLDDYNVVQKAPNGDVLSFMNKTVEKDYLKASEWAKSNGYDAIKFPTEGEVRIINKDSVKTKAELTDVFNKAKATDQPKLSPAMQRIQDMKVQATDLTKTVIQKPIKGTEDALVTGNQLNQISNLSDAKGIDDMNIQAISSAVTGKQNVAELTNQEAYDVSETIRMFNDTGEFLYGDDDMIVRQWTHPARKWMRAAEDKLKVPVNSRVYQPIERATRELKRFKQSWQNESREVFGKYSKPKFYEERRAITRYLEGDTKSLLDNKIFSDVSKKELVVVADWLKGKYKVFFEKLGISSEKFFGQYSPQIRDRGGIFNLYKTDELPNELSAIYRFEREGSFAPREEDALALFDMYTNIAGKELLLKKPLEEAKIAIEKFPENIKAGANDYIQEKLGYQDKVAQTMNKWSQGVAKKLGGKLPEDFARQTVDYGVGASYAGALGLPRIMPIIRNEFQQVLNYAEYGPKYFFKAKFASAEVKLKAEKILDEKGMLVAGGTPYSSELAEISKKSKFGRALNHYKTFNETMMKPYASVDTRNRVNNYLQFDMRFNEYWDQFKEGKIDWDTLEVGIELESFHPVLRNEVRQKLQSGKTKLIEEAYDDMLQDKLDDTQFPYRKGAESRAHYGVKGKLGLQFSQWSWEYAFTLKDWVARGQWMKLVRWYGASSAIERTWEEMAGVDVSKWLGLGPITGVPMGPLVNAAWSGIQMLNESMQGNSENVNKNWKDLSNTLQIYGGSITGVGKQRIDNVLQSVKRYDAGISQSPDPEKPFGRYSSTGKLLYWTDFNGLFKYALGFKTTEEAEFKDRLSRSKKDQIEYKGMVNNAMNMLVDGDMKKFDKYVTKNELYMGDVQAKLKSFNVELDQRIFQNFSPQLKEKYFNVFFPMNQ